VSCWRAERLREARTLYAGLLAKRGEPADARRLAVKIAAVDHPVAGAVVRRLLLDEVRDRTAAIASLGELVRAAPAFSVGHYLLGRQLVLARRYEEGARPLAEAMRLSLPGLELTVECRRLVGLASYQLGDYAGALKWFGDIVVSGAPPGIVLDAEDWIERCSWTRSRKGVSGSGPPTPARQHGVPVNPD